MSITITGINTNFSSNQATVSWNSRVGGKVANGHVRIPFDTPGDMTESQIVIRVKAKVREYLQEVVAALDAVDPAS
jgi:hypothetical protein